MSIFKKTPCNLKVTNNEKYLLYLALACSNCAYISQDTNIFSNFSKSVQYECPGYKVTLSNFGYTYDQEWISCETDIYTIIAFRGSDIFNKGIVSDWLQNLDIKYTNLDYFSIHSGFLQSAQGVFGSILPIILSAYNNKRKIIITGHSKGGAVAQIFCLLLKYYHNIMVDYLLTFASPAPFRGDNIINFMSPYNNRTVHVEAKWDPVPPSFKLFNSVACPSKILLIDSYTITILSHGTNNYLYGLNLKYGCKTNNICMTCPSKLNILPPYAGYPSTIVPSLSGNCS